MRPVAGGITFLVVLALGYLSGAFIEAEFDISRWEWITRTLVCVYSLMFAGFIGHYIWRRDA